MLGAMNANVEPKGQFTRGPWGLARRVLARGLLALGLPMLGACAPLTGLPRPPGAETPAPAIPGPFENGDPARPPAYKRPPQPTPKPPAREKREEDAPSFGGILRPGFPGPPEDRDKREREDD